MTESGTHIELVELIRVGLGAASDLLLGIVPRQYFLPLAAAFSNAAEAGAVFSSAVVSGDAMVNVGSPALGSNWANAALAGVARAAASHALERAVNDFAQQVNGNEHGGSTASSIMDTLVRVEDFFEAIVDVKSSMGSHDHSDDEDSSENPSDSTQSSEDDNFEEESP